MDAKPMAEQPTSKRAIPKAVWALVAAGVLLIVGSVLPWIRVRLDLAQFGEQTQTRTINGTDASDGKVFIVFGVILIALALGVRVARTKRLRRVIGGIGVCLAVFGVVANIIDISGLEDDGIRAIAKEISASQPSVALDQIVDQLRTFTHISTGIGLWITLVGNVVGVAGGIAAIAMRGQQQEQLPFASAVPPMPPAPGVPWQTPPQADPFAQQGTVAPVPPPTPSPGEPPPVPGDRLPPVP